MDLDCTSSGNFKISMLPYIYKIINEFTDKVRGATATSAAEYKFNIREDKESKKVPEEWATIFHYTVNQILFSVEGHEGTHRVKWYF